MQHSDFDTYQSNRNLHCSPPANEGFAEVQPTFLLAFSDGAGFAGVEANYYRRTPVYGLSPELRADSGIAACTKETHCPKR
jgi:hypothetical protein